MDDININFNKEIDASQNASVTVSAVEQAVNLMNAGVESATSSVAMVQPKQQHPVASGQSSDTERVAKWVSTVSPSPRAEMSCSDSESDTLTVVEDVSSVLTEKSGTTAIGQNLNDLKLQNTGFVKLSSAERRKFRFALKSGATREQALQAAKQVKSVAAKEKRPRSEEQPSSAPSVKKPRAGGTVA